MSDEKKVEEMLGTIEQMSVIELSNLVKAIEERFNVTAQAPIVATVHGTADLQGTSPGAGGEEKTTWTVILASAGDKKIQVIKEIRSVTNLGLKEAKDLVEGAPKTIKEGVNKEEAESIKKKIEAQGAKVELK